jgi:hypothetical protein
VLGTPKLCAGLASPCHPEWVATSTYKYVFSNIK